jgi:hypothetical protein
VLRRTRAQSSFLVSLFALDGLARPGAQAASVSITCGISALTKAVDALSKVQSTTGPIVSDLMTVYTRAVTYLWPPSECLVPGACEIPGRRGWDSARSSTCGRASSRKRDRCRNFVPSPLARFFQTPANARR